jgi:5S rRNA maturation endonuclease (ribonuclease M5)/archaellum biogenesis ATPase FlaH
MSHKTHQQCPDCNHRGCATFFDEGNWTCHSCGNKGWWKEKPAPKTLVGDEVTAYTDWRGIKAKTNEFYGIKTVYNDKGDPTGRLYPYPHKTKVRWLPKDFSANTGFSNDHLFGMDKFNAGSSNTVILVEGEEDVPSAYQMLGSKTPVVGIPGSTPPSKLWANCKEWLDSFKEIVVIPDNDKAGKKISDTLSRLYPNRTYEVSLTKHNDPNAFLQAGDTSEFNIAYSNRRKKTPSGIYNSTVDFSSILRQEKSVVYTPTPFVQLNEMVKGTIEGHLMLITGQEGLGKTEILHAMEYHILKHHDDIPIAVCHLEETKETTLRTYACYELEDNVRDPDTKRTIDEIDDAIKALTANEKLYLFEHGEEEDPIGILTTIRFLATACDVKVFFIDPIQQLAYSHNENQSEENVLTKLAVKMEKLCTDLGICIVLTAHVNDTGAVRSSRMIGKAASVRIDIERDHMNTDPIISNTSTLWVSKNRPISKTGWGGEVFFDHSTFMIKEPKDR